MEENGKAKPSSPPPTVESVRAALHSRLVQVIVDGHCWLGRIQEVAENDYERTVIMVRVRTSYGPEFWVEHTEVEIAENRPFTA